MPQLDISTYPPQLVWLLITFVALYLVVWKVALPRIVDVRESRQRRIEDDLGKAETLRTEAETVLAALEKSHADAAAEAQGIHRDTAYAIGVARTKLQEETAARLA
ncbi:MAG: F0F1 ATP synthase subunit B', partial [Pseudomonadota bacterium]|nr:F0F1 ATP synthase subunit B' [Pseudomonadota bacterium]